MHPFVVPDLIGVLEASCEALLVGAVDARLGVAGVEEEGDENEEGSGENLGRYLSSSKTRMSV